MITTVISEDARSVAENLSAVLSPLGGRSVLVTGASGFLGGFFCDVLAAFNERLGELPHCRVTALDNYLVGLPSRLEHLRNNRDFVFVAHDIAKPIVLERVPDYIIHLASIGSPMIYRPRPIETVATNVDGTRHMLELARRGSTSMLYFSSSEVYGDPAPEAIPTPEDYRGNVSFTGPRACYDESKRLCETLCVDYWRQHKVPVKTIRPFNVYGPGQRLDDGRIVPDLLQAAMKGGPIVLFSDGRATRSFCYVADFVRACLTVLMSDANGEAFNVGNDTEIAIGDAARIMASVAAEPPIPIEFRQSEDTDFLVDNPQRRCPDLGKLRRAFGFEPHFDLHRGFSRTLASYREEWTCSASRQSAAQ